MVERTSWRRLGGLFCALVLAACTASAAANAAVSIYGRGLTDESIDYLEDEDLAPVAKPLVLFGDPFLLPGNIEPGIELPTGAVWHPSLWIYGTGRTALQTFDAPRGDRITEWANSFDAYANLQLSGTERLVLGINPLRRGANYSGYTFEPGSLRGFDRKVGLNVTTLFAEGDFGELFPNLDLDDSGILDFGFAVGRQAITFQQGLLIDDTELDSIGIVRNSLSIPGGSNLRITGLYAWNEVSRADSENDRNANLYGLFSEADFFRSTVALDLIYVDSDDTGGDGLYLGVSTVRRFGLWTSSLRFLTSQALDGDTDKVRDGYLLFADLSTTPLGTDDILYFTAFVAYKEFTQAARDPQVGGPLGRAGILFANPRLGRYGAPLSNRANDVLGVSVGRQWFLTANNREQFVLEAGARKSIGGHGGDTLAVGGRYQIQIHNNAFWQFDMFGSYLENEGYGFGARSEIQVKF